MESVFHLPVIDWVEIHLLMWTISMTIAIAALMVISTEP